MKLSKIKARYNKRDLDEKVAVILGIPRAEVAVITATFMRVLSHHLLDHGPVKVDGFGTFSLQKWNDLVHIQVRRSYIFTRIHRLKNMAKSEEEDQMDKFAVVEDIDQEKLEKQAAQGCPECGSKVERHGTTLICPKCGSAPFEGKDSNK